jgi:hypothetical protein
MTSCIGTRRRRAEHAPRRGEAAVTAAQGRRARALPGGSRRSAPRERAPCAPRRSRAQRGPRRRSSAGSRRRRRRRPARRSTGPRARGRARRRRRRLASAGSRPPTGPAARGKGSTGGRSAGARARPASRRSPLAPCRASTRGRSSARARCNRGSALPGGWSPGHRTPDRTARAGSCPRSTRRRRGYGRSRAASAHTRRAAVPRRPLCHRAFEGQVARREPGGLECCAPRPEMRRHARAAGPPRMLGHPLALSARRTRRPLAAPVLAPRRAAGLRDPGPQRLHDRRTPPPSREPRMAHRDVARRGRAGGRSHSAVTTDFVSR